MLYKQCAEQRWCVLMSFVKYNGATSQTAVIGQLTMTRLKSPNISKFLALRNYSNRLFLYFIALDEEYNTVQYTGI